MVIVYTYMQYTYSIYKRFIHIKCKIKYWDGTGTGSEVKTAHSGLLHSTNELLLNLSSQRISVRGPRI